VGGSTLSNFLLLADTNPSFRADIAIRKSTSKPRACPTRFFALTRSCRATGHEGRSYALTGGEALTNGQIAEKISRVAGRKISYIDLPPAEFKTAMLSAGTPEWSAEAMVDLQRFYRVGKAKQTTHDVERFLGRKPITFDQFAHDYAFAFREEEKVAS
jgi:uncharacterized protein YbjT (DUF2867 family)